MYLISQSHYIYIHWIGCYSFHAPTVYHFSLLSSLDKIVTSAVQIDVDIFHPPYLINYTTRCQQHWLLQCQFFLCPHKIQFFTSTSPKNIFTSTLAEYHVYFYDLPFPSLSTCRCTTGCQQRALTTWTTLAVAAEGVGVAPWNSWVKPTCTSGASHPTPQTTTSSTCVKGMSWLCHLWQFFPVL